MQGTAYQIRFKSCPCIENVKIFHLSSSVRLKLWTTLCTFLSLDVCSRLYLCKQRGDFCVQMCSDVSYIVAAPLIINLQLKGQVFLFNYR